MCNRYYDRHIVCDGLIIDNGKILLGLRDLEPDRGKWALFGGFLDWNETIEEAILREIKEEAGVNTEIVRLLGIYSDPDRSQKEQNVSVAYVLKINTDDKLIPQPGEIKELKWFNLDDLPGVIAFDHREMINDYLKSENS
ncbi:MAG: hypothetical protein A2857_04385 [Candidatus Levybacteria bacterium RIFCSPHIGHO2_01_FULL_36_15]|nr:MAG: hypothetical protein A2857_04385 [Candidatus Levybacteria bacterium RIFCSPHIGHO2_01_FULL_36_15]OGH37612.1 MAG: hypothetical protein A2905_05000 [Candidatus Levybacteria bacterium RIFCSPLOWO2_01_FULL_36_10]